MRKRDSSSSSMMITAQRFFVWDCVCVCNYETLEVSAICVAHSPKYCLLHSARLPVYCGFWRVSILWFSSYQILTSLPANSKACSCISKGSVTCSSTDILYIWHLENTSVYLRLNHYRKFDFYLELTTLRASQGHFQKGHRRAFRPDHILLHHQCNKMSIERAECIFGLSLSFLYKNLRTTGKYRADRNYWSR